MSADLGNLASTASSFSAFVRRQFTTPNPRATDLDLSHQVAVITGANAGLGFESGRQLLRANLSHLILAVRSQSRGDAAAQSLREEFPDAEVSVWLLDLLDYGSVRAFADQCARAPRIDMVILNAGLQQVPYTEAPKTGHEVTIQVNYLSTALLAYLLVPALKYHSQKPRTGNPRATVLSVVGSDMMYADNVNTESPIVTAYDGEAAYDPQKMYGESKFLLCFFIERLSQTVKPSDVLINMPNPGLTAGTSFFSARSAIVRSLARIGQAVLARSVEVSATIYVDAVTASGEKTHGSFLSEWGVAPFPSLWYTSEGKDFSERLWNETLEEFGVVRG
ncbi:retinol dehydrogenase 12 [Plectosphaerella plurivora]|uniref:Retinol dehydrogenase 12 n=1 Tax=Plectosphaerella plurivora TaxID=936078 RepID=A0A9P9A8J7_9PEZI|nr:retinol dehydrogenase 12 [Plectosphaerella plurivora]